MLVAQLPHRRKRQWLVPSTFFRGGRSRRRRSVSRPPSWTGRCWTRHGVLPRDLTRKEWLRQGAPKPRPNYALPHKACWACGVRGHKRGSPDCRQPNAVVCFGCGEPGKTKATCPTCSELWESDEVLAGRWKAMAQPAVGPKIRSREESPPLFLVTACKPSMGERGRL